MWSAFLSSYSQQKKRCEQETSRWGLIATCKAALTYIYKNLAEHKDTVLLADICRSVAEKLQQNFHSLCCAPLFFPRSCRSFSSETALYSTVTIAKKKKKKKKKSKNKQTTPPAPPPPPPHHEITRGYPSKNRASELSIDFFSGEFPIQNSRLWNFSFMLASTTRWQSPSVVTLRLRRTHSLTSSVASH